MLKKAFLRTFMKLTGDIIIFTIFMIMKMKENAAMSSCFVFFLFSKTCFHLFLLLLIGVIIVSGSALTML